jgi:hypothetical protein
VGCRAGLNVLTSIKSVASVWSRCSLVQPHSRKYGYLSIPRLYSNVLVGAPRLIYLNNAMVMLSNMITVLTKYKF